MFAQILIYWIVIQLLGLAALPVAALLFRSLPDRGYPFAKTLGLLLVGWGAWLVAMVGLAPFGLLLLLTVGIALTLAGWAGLRRPKSAAAEALALHRQWPSLLAYELIFLAALIFAAWMRGYQPDPWGTERPMDFAFFNAIRRGGSFPPEDPWLAGFSINYYYMGYLLMAVVATFSGLAPAVAYNLSLALIFALTALGVAGIVRNLIMLSTGRKAFQADQEGAEAYTPRPSRALRARSRGEILAWICTLFAVVCVLLVGNQAGATQLIGGSEQVVALDTMQLFSTLGQGLLGARTITLPYKTPPIADFNAPEGLRYWERRNMSADFNSWWPSRALWDDIPNPTTGQVERRYTITEFPFFSFWLGDMHPHVMSLPFTLLALALALATLTRSTAPTFSESQRGWVELALTGVILGGLYMINSWDLPTYLLIYAGALLLLYMRLAAGGPLLWQHAARNLILVALATFLLYVPFHLTFHSLVGGKERLLAVPIIGRVSRTLGVFLVDKTSLSYFLVIFGLFLIPLLAFVMAQGGLRAPSATLGLTAVRSGPRIRGAEIGVLATVAAFALGLGIDFPLVALLPLGLYASWLALRISQNDDLRMTSSTQREDILRSSAAVRNSAGLAFALWATAMGCFICFGTELIYIRDVFEGFEPRMNTIFKFYYQTWLIWGTLTGYALWWLLARTRRAVALPLTVLTMVLLIGGLVYPALTAGRLPVTGTWRGLAGETPRDRSPEGQASIAWLRSNAPAGAVVLEAVGGSYNGEGFAGVSAGTGIATVIGWPGHQSQWRGGDPHPLSQLGSREEDVRTIYTTGDVEQARQLLERYGVTYIYVGDLERQTYGLEGETKFATLGDPVFQQGSVTIYKIR